MGNIEVDVFEGELEFDRLHAMVSWPQIERYAHKLHASQGHLGDTPKLRHCHAVSELAARYAKEIFYDDDFFAQRYRTLVCRAGGMLHEAIDTGAFFEEVVKAGDEHIARLVASVSMDRRLPGPKRIRIYGNQIGLASAAAQAVKLADLQHDCLLLTRNLDLPAEAWVEEAKDILGSLGRIHAVPALALHAKQLKEDLQALDKSRKPKRNK